MLMTFFSKSSTYLNFVVIRCASTLKKSKWASKLIKLSATLSNKDEFSKYNLLLLNIFSFTLSLCKSLNYYSKNYVITLVKVHPAKQQAHSKSRPFDQRRILLSAPNFLGDGKCMSWKLIQLFLLALMKALKVREVQRQGKRQ